MEETILSRSRRLHTFLYLFGTNLISRRNLIQYRNRISLRGGEGAEDSK